MSQTTLPAHVIERSIMTFCVCVETGNGEQSAVAEVEFTDYAEARECYTAWLDAIESRSVTWLDVTIYAYSLTVPTKTVASTKYRSITPSEAPETWEGGQA